MPKTVLITGASTGIGRATAIVFQQQGWNVAATLRSPDQAKDLDRLTQVICPYLDVTKPESIALAIQTTLQQFGTIDAVVNNAGYGLLGAFEVATPEQVQRQFATNVFGVMAVTRAILPHFREKQQGMIVNITSIGGRIAFPLYSLYHSTKWAVEGFSESLRYELEPFNIHVKLVEPGPIKTDFYGRSADITDLSNLPDYETFAQQVIPRMNAAGEKGSSPNEVAKVIYRAVTDGKTQLRYPAGKNAALLLTLRKILPDWVFSSIVRAILIA